MDEKRNSAQHLGGYNYTVSKKTIPNIIGCNRKKDYQILIGFGKNIPDTTDHQMTVQIPSVCSCTIWGNQNKQNITLLFKIA